MNNTTKQLPAPNIAGKGWPWEENQSISYNTENQEIKISVITISYNQAQYLEATIRSILLQDYSNFEYIIIDGGSTDGSVDIIKNYEPFIKYWISEKDNGPANALNKGLEQCTGEFLYYLNSDDIIQPGTFSYINKFILENPGFDVYYGHGYMTYGSLDQKFPIYSVKWNLNQYINHLVSIIQQSTFIRIDAVNSIGGFNEANRTQWDGELIVDLELAKFKFKRYNRHVAVFRVYPTSITGSEDKTKYHADFNRIKSKVSDILNFKEISKNMLRLVQLFNDPIISLKKIYTHFVYLR